MVEWVEIQPNNLLTWQTFINMFGGRFLNSQHEESAKIKIENIQIQNNEMDQYISLFEELAVEADYNLDSKPVMNLFQKGLNYALNNHLFSYTPLHQDWAELKFRVVQAANAKVKMRTFHNRPFSISRAQGQNEGQWCSRQSNQPRPQGRAYGDCSQIQNYNSTNAPHTYSNCPVPMDLSCM